MTTFTLDTLMHNSGFTKEMLTKRTTSLYDVLLIAYKIGYAEEGCKLVEVMNCLIIEAEEALTKVYWRTRWSSGPSSWVKGTFNQFRTPEDIKEDLAELARLEGEWSEHYRGFDFVIVKSWDTDPNTALNKVSV